MLKALSFIFSVIFIAGCSSMPGNVGTTVSKLDNERQVHVTPGWIYAGGLKLPEAKLGGFWTDKTPDIFFLETVVIGANSIEGLKISVDGQISEFSPSETLTDFSTAFESAKRFAVPLTFVKQMMSAKKVIVQIRLSRSYVEGEFSFEQTSYAKPAFRKALRAIDSPAP